MKVCRNEVWLVDLSDNKGSEQGGLRPALVVQNELGNKFAPTTIVCPLTSKTKNNISTHLTLTPEDCGIQKPSTVLFEQIRVIDKTRAKKKLGEVTNKEIIQEINNKILLSLGMS